MQRSETEALKTLAALSSILLIIGLWTHRPAWLILSAALLVIAFFIRPLAVRIARAWLAFGAVLNRINSQVILALTFVLVVTPIAWLQRRIKGDFLGLKRRTGTARTYWVPREHVYGPGDFKNLW